MNCPICGGEMWDNRERKRNPKAPDYKCKDKSCEGVIWPPKGGRLSHDPQERKVAAGPKWTWFRLAKTYEWALLSAEPRVTALAERLGKAPTVEDVTKAAASIFIEACRTGVEDPKARLPKEPPKTAPLPPEPEPEEFEEDQVPF